MYIADLIISILSLIATIAISFVIYFLEKRNQQMYRAKEIKEAAKRFILDNSDEIDYLHWATIAAGCFPQNKHIRKIYNEFTFLDDETKKEVLKQRGLECCLINDNVWIIRKIKLIVECIKELGIGTDFLYDDGKHFTRSYNYKKHSVLILEHLRWTRGKFKNIFQIRRNTLGDYDNLTYEQYLNDFLYCKYDEPNKMPKDAPLPNDYLIEVENLRSCETKYLCYWMMVMVKNVIDYSTQYLDYERINHSETDAEVETYEDKYFSVLYELYYLTKKEK